MKLLASVSPAICVHDASFLSAEAFLLSVLAVQQELVGLLFPKTFSKLR